MRLVKIAAGTAMVLTLVLAPLEAAQKGPKGASPAKASSTKTPKTAKTPTAPKAPKVTTAKVTKAPKVTTAPKVAAKVETKLAKADTKSARKAGTTATTTTSSTTSSTSTSATATTTVPTAIDFSKGAVAERLARNTNLRTKLETRLLAAGYEGTVYQAAYGFRNQGQFIAATNVSRNTGASFEQLKLQMTGLSIDAAGVVLKANRLPDGTIVMVDPAAATTPAPTRSLGQAIKVVNSTLDATAAAQTATTQADAEIASTTVTN
jgi:hypothetical protein